MCGQNTLWPSTMIFYMGSFIPNHIQSNTLYTQHLKLVETMMETADTSEFETTGSWRMSVESIFDEEWIFDQRRHFFRNKCRLRFFIFWQNCLVFKNAYVFLKVFDFGIPLLFSLFKNSCPFLQYNGKTSKTGIGNSYFLNLGNYNPRIPASKGQRATRGHLLRCMHAPKGPVDCYRQLCCKRV